MKVREILPDQYFPLVSVWCFRSSFEKSTRWQQLKSDSNPPLSPFSKGEFSPCDSNPSLEKRGKGRFSDGTTRHLCGELVESGHQFKHEQSAPITMIKE
jgi:hypothetical protein